jgi:hypothetical protein
VKIWVDDIRTPPDDTWKWLKTSAEAIEWLEDSKVLCKETSAAYNAEIMSLDHDLGGDDTTRPIVLWMCENDFWPLEVRVHSQNPVGCDWLNGILERYHPSNTFMWRT